MTTAIYCDEVWGHSVNKVRASREELLAFLWNTKARNQFKKDTLAKKYAEEISKHNRVEYTVKKLTPLFQSRDFVSAVVWTHVDAKTSIFVLKPRLQKDLPENPLYVRAYYDSVSKLEQKQHDVTEITAVLKQNAGVRLPRVIEETYVAYNLNRATKTQQYFQELRQLNAFDANDGSAIGVVFMITSKTENRKEVGKTHYDVRKKQEG